MNKALFISVIICAVCLIVNATLRIAIHEDSCNSASLSPDYSSRKSIKDQLTNGELTTATTVKDADFTLTYLKSNFDVVYLGCGGKDLDMERLSSDAATAIVNFVSQGGGLVISATTPTAFDAVREIIEDLMPLPLTDLAWARTTSQNNVPLLRVTNTNHYITSHALTSTEVAPVAFAFYVQGALASGWTSIADVEYNTAECCLGFMSCDSSYCTPYKNQGIAVKQYGSGRIAYINLAFCGYEMFGPHNLRNGNINQLFLNMFYWTSGLCKNKNECSNHGACTGSNTCRCDNGWDGADCSQPVCNQVCQHGGHCVSPNTCECTDKYAPPDCTSCIYPYAGEDCNSHSEIQNPSFENTPLVWELSNSNVLKTDASKAKDGSKLLVFEGQGTYTVTQELFAMNRNEASPYLSMWYYASSPGSSKLQIVLNNTVVIWESPSSPATSWQSVSTTLKDYSSDEGRRQLITIKATITSSSAKFYVDLVKNEYPNCDPPCATGMCAKDGDGSNICVCDEHHSGELCDHPRCGDAEAVYPETCDDGNNISGDGCSEECTVEDGWECAYDYVHDAGGWRWRSVCTDICGDGRTVSNASDACDDGNLISGDGCSSTCKIEHGYTCTQDPSARSICQVFCGDGLIFGPEACDVGDNNMSAEGCSSDCRTVTAGWDCTYMYNQYGNNCTRERCGDGHKTKSEECDDGNNIDGDGCSANCTIEYGWHVEPGPGVWPLSIMKTECGDGITVVGQEECDGGSGCIPEQSTNECHAMRGYACDVDNVTLKSRCYIKCGDGIVMEPEECDDGNVIDGDGCSSDCKVETGYHCVDDSNCVQLAPNVCGDGKKQNNETCDIGHNTSPGCVNCIETPGWHCDNTHCETRCGDGILTEDEVCDCGCYNVGGAKPQCSYSTFCDIVNSCNDCKSYDTSAYVCRNLTYGNSIRSSCRSLCGNGIRTSNEECDDNNTLSGDGCSRECKLEEGWTCTTPINETSICTPDCGDYNLVGPETCDEGPVNTKGCINCVLQFGYVCNSTGQECHCVHGDGLICNDEECDDGNPNSEGCRNGKVNTAGNWECFNVLTGTGGIEHNISVCAKKVCGNGFLNSGEECDDGNTVSGDGCSANCKLESPKLFECHNGTTRSDGTECHKRKCGDGYITDDEECDDGVGVNGNGCNSTCQIEKFFECEKEGPRGPSKCRHQFICGDGYHHPDEGCDDGNKINGDGCNSDCKVESGWVCVDEGVQSECHKVVCGDGKFEGEEECDDGNLDNGDGCNFDCKIEPGFRCYVSYGMSKCSSFCGDGLKSSNEECDDGNFVGGDGCSPTCKIEHGYTCVVNYTDPECIKGNCISQCFATCGDGIVAQEEECDDANSFQGDGCYKCKLESEDWRCKGEPSVCILRKCTLPQPEAIVTHVLCAGASTGVIDVTLNTSDEFVTKIWKENENEPSSYQSKTHYPNLAAGNYYVRTAVVGFMDCSSEAVVEVSQPAGFKNLKSKYQTGFGWPSRCSVADGWIKWNPSGGVKPYRFYFGNRTVQDNGNFDNVDIYEFISGPPVLIDGNNCSRTMEPEADYWPSSENCKKEDVPYMIEGSVVLAASFVVAIVAGIAYSCWSSTKQVPKNWKGGK